MEHLIADSICQWSPGDWQMAIGGPKPEVQQIMEIYNFTTNRIGVSDARGIKRVYSPVMNAHRGFKGKRGLVIKFHDVYNSDIKKQILSLSQVEHSEDNEHFKATVEVLEEKQSGFGHAVILSAFIAEEKIPRGIAGLYAPAGILIQWLPKHFDERDLDKYIPDHPNSPRGMLKAGADFLRDQTILLNRAGLEVGEPDFSSVVGMPETVFTRSMILIEGDSNRYGQMFVRQRGELLDGKYKATAIKAKVNPSLKPGLYVRTNMPSTSALTQDRVHVFHVEDPAQFELYDVYTTLKAATTPDPVTLSVLHADNQSRQLEQQKARLELECEKTAQMQLDLDKLKDDHTRALEAAQIKHDQVVKEAQFKQEQFDRQTLEAKLEHQQTLKVLEAKAHAAEVEAKLLRDKQETERQKEISERRGNTRKVVLEVLKFIPAVILGVLGLFKFGREFFTIAAKFA